MGSRSTNCHAENNGTMTFDIQVLNQSTDDQLKAIATGAEQAIGRNFTFDIGKCSEKHGMF